MSGPASDLRSVRRAAEARYAAWARFVAAHPWMVLLATLALMGTVAPHAGRIEVDTHPEKFMHAEHPIRIAYGAFKERFGSDNFVLVSVESDRLFTLDVLDWLRALHEALETEVPQVAEVDSLINARSTRGEGDELIVEDLFEDWPETEADVARIRDLVRRTPFYQRTVIGDDERHTALLVEVDPWVREGDGEDLLGGFEEAAGASADAEAARRPAGGREDAAMVAAVRAIQARFARPDVTIRVAGIPAMNVAITESMGRNIARYVSLSVVAIVFVLAFLLRRVAGVLLPLGVVAAALATMAGVMGLRAEPVNITVQILPSLLLAVGASASIHLLVLFFRRFDEGGTRAEALEDALGHAGLPITMACVTTAAGMASFLASELTTVRDIGILAPIGILLVLGFALTWLPAMLCLVPLARRRAGGEPHGVVADAVVAAGDWSVRHPGRVLAGAALVAAFGLAGAPRIGFDTNPLDNIEPDSPYRETVAIADAYMGGTTSLELVIDTGEPNGLHDPARQRALEDLAAWIEAYDDDDPFVRKVVSVNDVLKEIHQALNENRPEFYATPDDRTLIAQELLLFENSGSDDLEEMVDSQFQIARVSVLAGWDSAKRYTQRIPDIVAAARERFPGATVQETGIMTIIARAMYETQMGTVRSYALALLTITPLMMLLVGTFRGGLSSMVPNLVPVILVLGAFGWLGVSLDAFATMTGSIAIGLAVDDTIHFFHAFYREFERTGDTRLSVRRTLESTGRALLTTTIVLSIGFSAFLFSTLRPVQIFGLATTLAILLAFLADVLIAPALVTLATRGRQREGVPPIA